MKKLIFLGTSVYMSLRQGWKYLCLSCRLLSPADSEDKVVLGDWAATYLDITRGCIGEKTIVASTATCIQEDYENVGSIGGIFYISRVLDQYITTKMLYTYAHVPHHITSPVVRNITSASSLAISSQSTSPDLEVLAHLAEPAIVQRLWKHAIVQQLEKIPFAGTALGLEVPENPAVGPGFVRFKLHFDVAPHAVFPLL